MKKVFIFMAVIALTFSATFALAQWWTEQQAAQSNTLLQPYTLHAYGDSVHSDATGRPFEYRTYGSQPQEAVPGFVPVRPDAYGLGVGMDAYGRPVRAYPK